MTVFFLFFLHMRGVPEPWGRKQLAVGESGSAAARVKSPLPPAGRYDDASTSADPRTEWVLEK